MEERENKREETASDAELQRLVEDFITQKQVLLIQVKKGVLGKEEFLQEAGKHIDQYYHFPATKRKRLLKSFEQYIFGYSRLSPLMDDKSISDIQGSGQESREQSLARMAEGLQDRLRSGRSHCGLRT